MNETISELPAVSSASRQRVSSFDVAETSIAADIVAALESGLSRDGFLRAALPHLLRAVEGESGGIVVQNEGRWQPEAWVGTPESLPDTLISEAVDESSPQFRSGWGVAPLAQDRVADPQLPASPLAAFVYRTPVDAQPSEREAPLLADRLARAVRVLDPILERVEAQELQSRRIAQLSAVLEAAATWQRIDDDVELLTEIADTACNLVRCERASIFLWDRRGKKLIGRPALGVEGNRLEVDDNVGVVGEVLRTGEAKLWSADRDDESRVNRAVDRKLDFETRSLAAVPMGGSRDALLGVFEAINHKGNGFDNFDLAVLNDLSAHAAVAIEAQRKRRTLIQSRDRLVDAAASATQLIGNHPSMENVRVSAGKVAATDLTVLVLGKNGTGKEVLARHIHYESQRRSGPFIAVNCAALVETLLESELFGHEKGAFTDANQTRAGKFELASGGTLFLDEVGDMSPGGQAKLLRVLEDRVVVRVGGSQTIPVDTRVIAATNQPLEELISAKRFREDLFFRLNVVSLTLPPLSRRGDDVLLLADHFLKQFCYEIGRQVPELSESARQALITHPWPGNIRELRNTIERLCYLCSENVVHAADLMLSGSPATRLAGQAPADAAESLSDATRDFQVAHIDAAIAACGGNMTDAAARLGLHRSNLYRKMRQLGMPTSAQ